MVQVRYKVEDAGGLLKRHDNAWTLPRHAQQCDMDVNVITGPVNLKMLWPYVKVACADTIRCVTAWRE